MKRSTRRWWWVFAFGVTTVVSALIGITVVVLDLEASQVEAQRQMRHADTSSVALWRMDSWLAPHLATEAARSPEQYDSASESVAASGPSPLLSFRSDFIRLHVQTPLPAQKQEAEQVGFCSPQVPVDPTPPPYAITPEQLDSNAVILGQVQTILDVELACGEVMEKEAKVLGQQPQAVPPKEVPQQVTQQWLGYNKRAQFSSNMVQNEAWSENEMGREPSPMPDSFAGPLVPIWVPASTSSTNTDELFYLRRVRTDGKELLQGFLVDWPTLRDSLLSEIDDLFPNASLDPILTELKAEAQGNALATVPVTLRAPLESLRSGSSLTPARITLLVTWIAVLFSLGIATTTLRASVAFGEKRSRFASAVTHELRTPLTTFRMYSEMLADGMIQDESKRQLYLNTIKDESSRLAALVENVLAYSRIEEGSQPTRREEISLQSILDRVVPNLERRAEEANAELSITQVDGALVNGAVQLFADTEAVGQILYNLVDNACKYGCEENHKIDIEIRPLDARMEIRVRDHGPGIPKPTAGGVFAPFDRCGRESTNTPGVGLGLALSRELAREMGGELRLEASDRGACFALTLPTYGK